ncbi:Transcription factor mbp1 [Marasmius crinis-equi]|uniref:Transcription factor mbp1 n=1 Tax=Marasmius crinis-equi TaxID=585013 RepID=A0ABR3FZC0_9AGAR
MLVFSAVPKCHGFTIASSTQSIPSPPLFPILSFVSLNSFLELLRAPQNHQCRVYLVVKMPDNQVFKATYSGIPVYEMMCKGVAVMRRRADAWLNATQILKVAGFDKPQRTRVLEREVQKGEHEKVQGGYGKYQGTWIPLERGLALAKQYNCDHILKPIIEFQPAAKSPPLAPRHLVSSAAPKPARRNEGTSVNTRSSRKQVVAAEDSETEQDTLSVRGSEDGSMSPSPSEASSSSRTPSPIRSPGPDYGNGHRKGKHHHSLDLYAGGYDNAPLNGALDARAYGDQILEYFISDTNQVPQILITPPADFNPDMAIDDDGHTALHWACAMGRIRIVKLLLTAGADIYKVNKGGQTPLMRSVMFANNYDVRKFPELYELLHKSTLNIDNYNRTVFHHVIDVAMSKGKTHAARYYMETILARLADYPKELADVINFQDADGETALTMAARCRSKRLVKLLIDHGADPKITNNDGKSTEDYILEDERFRSSPVPTSRVAAMSFRNAQVAFPPSHASGSYSFAPANGDRPPLHYSVAAQRASTRCVNDMTSMLDSLASSFDQELRDKERDTTQAHALLSNIQAEILESQRTVAILRSQSDNLTDKQQTLVNLESELHSRMGRRYRLGWEKWVKDEENREKTIRDAAGGSLALTQATATYRVEEEELQGDPREGDRAKSKRKAYTQSEDIADLTGLHSDIPSDPEGLKRACDALREDIGRHRKRRRELFDELVTFQAEAGTRGKMADYRKLIASGCGDLPLSEVDSVLGLLLETLESDDPNSSTTAWGFPKAPSGFWPRLCWQSLDVMPLKRLTRHDIITAVTKSPWTTNFRHLLPVTSRLHRSLDRPTVKDFSKKVARTKDRIKWWNVVPGDQIRLLGDVRGTLQEVMAINRFRNRVYVRGTQSGEEDQQQVKRKNKNYHYSRCQLYLGEYEFPPKKGETKAQTLPVFAKRLGTSPPAWNSFLRRYQWDRFATTTTPTIPHLKGERINIPWPKTEPRLHADPTQYDTTKAEVVRITYEPPPFSPTLKGLIPRIPSEREFLRSLYNSAEHGDEQQAVEQFLFRELSNPHSRAKKLKRWQNAQMQKKALLKSMIAEEQQRLDGRTAGEAKAEATFKWRQKLDEEKKALRKARWQRRGGDVALEKKHARRLRKEEKKRARLTALTLKEEHNQVIPKDLLA